MSQTRRRRHRALSPQYRAPYYVCQHEGSMCGVQHATLPAAMNHCERLGEGYGVWRVKCSGPDESGNVWVTLT